MNERIMELAEQATERVGVKIWDEYAGVFYTETHLKLNQEKFAELIVRECAGIYSKIDNGNLHMGTDDYLEALHKTFFGVEQ